MLLQNKVALITGAASGIGRATAQLFSSQGAKVAVADIDDSGAAETVRSIRRSSGEAFSVHADVGRMDSVEAMVGSALDRYGRLDIVHSNAAAYVLGTASETSEADWDRTLDVCLKATWMIARCALPPMVAQGWRHIHYYGIGPFHPGLLPPCRLSSLQGGLAGSHPVPGRGLCALGSGECDSARRGGDRIVERSLSG